MGRIKRIVLTLSVAFLWNCQTQVPVTEVKNAETLYERGFKQLKKKNYIYAEDAFNEVRRRFPQSRFVALSELRMADMFFERDLFNQAASLYGSFVDLYPQHKEAPYALYRKALSHFEDRPSNIARDQSPMILALNSSRKLLRRYSSSKYTKECEDIISKARLTLAQKEAYVARYYEKKKQYSAALFRWKELLRRFPDLEKNTQDGATQLLETAKSKKTELEAKI